MGEIHQHYCLMVPKGATDGELNLTDLNQKRDHMLRECGEREGSTKSGHRIFSVSSLEVPKSTDKKFLLGGILLFGLTAPGNGLPTLVSRKFQCLKGSPDHKDVASSSSQVTRGLLKTETS